MGEGGAGKITKSTIKHNLLHITSTNMTHSHPLLLLSYTILSLLGLSHAFPNPQATSVPPNPVTNVAPSSLPTPVAAPGIGTGTTGTFLADSSDNATNTISAADDVVDDVDLVDFVFNPLQMPTQTGSSETEVVEAFLTRPSADPNDALTSRSISNYVTLHANDGSTSTRNGTTVYSTDVNNTAMAQMFQDATAYSLAQYNTGNLLGIESDHNYYRFTSQGLTIAAMAYGEAGSGPQPFNWGDFSLITGFLTNLTIKYPTSNMTWNGYVTMSDGSRGVDFFVAPSFGDIPAPAPAAASPPASNHPGGADGGLRLAKRAYTIALGVDGIHMTVRRATTRVMTGMLYHLCSNALTSLIADSGQNPTYAELITRTGDALLDRAFPNAVMQIVATVEQPLSKDLVIAALSFLTSLTEHTHTNAGTSSTLYGELRAAGITVARWSLGAAIAGPSCVVQHPDGSYAVGCFIRTF